VTHIGQVGSLLDIPGNCSTTSNTELFSVTYGHICCATK
jgi:hypothetical protein